jgi:phage-related protein|tara:strand:- start:174 stop:1304 length:1131 start_codon:yes stop_codon:yes gene_type:complete
MDIKNTNSFGINLSPSFGASASFSSVSEYVNYGDSHSQRMLKGINGLSMSLDLSFNELTDPESQDLVSFLQSQFHYQEQAYSNDGSFSNKRLIPFAYQPFFPYKENQFNCLEFSHDQSYFNINNISAKLVAIAPSILNSIESAVDHNPIIDGTINATINANSSVSNNGVLLPSNSFIYQSGNYSHAKITSDFNVTNGNTSVLSADAPFRFNAGNVSCNQTAIRNSIYINNPNDCSYYPYAPIVAGGNLSCRMFDFRPSISVSLQNSPKYKQSTASDIYKKFNKYGFNPNLNNLRLSFKGRSDQEAKRILLFLESHLGYKKFGFHLSKDYVGSNSDIINTSPHRKGMSFFYCPEWQHTFTYKDNHNISASFVECIDY